MNMELKSINVVPLTRKEMTETEGGIIGLVIAYLIQATIISTIVVTVASSFQKGFNQGFSDFQEAENN